MGVVGEVQGGGGRASRVMVGRGEREKCVWYNLVQHFFSVKQNRTFHKSFKIHDNFSLFIFDFINMNN